MLKQKLQTVGYAVLGVSCALIPSIAYAIPGPAPITDPSGATIVPEFGLLTDPNATNQAALIPYIINILLYLVTAIAILFIVIAGYRLVTARGEEETLTKAKSSLLYAIAGLVVITFARIITTIFFEYGRGGTDPTQVFEKDLAYRTIEALTGFGLFLLGVVSIMFLVIAGYRLVASRGEEEELTKAKHSLMYGVGGLVVVTLASVLTNIFFEGTTVTTPGEAFDPNLAESTVQTLIQFGQILLGSIAVLFIVIAGYRFVTARGEEEELTKAKQSLMYAAGGLMVVVLAEAITRVFYNYEQGGVPAGDTKLGIQTIVSITNFVLAFVGVVAVLMLIIAGYQYITARGEEGQLEKAKQSILTAAIGLVVIVFAYAVVSIIVRGAV